jgi:4-aminobutyrate aminotransferase-like enzyme
LRQGVLALAGGAAGNVLTLTPPITITEDQIDFAADVIEDCLARA